MRRVQTQFVSAPVPVGAPVNRFGKYYSGYWHGYIYGIVYLLFTIALFVLEICRIFRGSLNRSLAYKLYPNNIYYPPYYYSGNPFNFERTYYLWPWSHPVLLFSIFPMLAGIFGFVAARRATYSMIVLLYTFSLFTLAVTPYLIGYYSVNINRHNSIGDAGNLGPGVDQALSIVLLVLILFLACFSFFFTIWIGMAFSCCRIKGGSLLTPVERYPTQMIPLGPTAARPAYGI